jgi:FkbM family methyltransferase
MNAVLRLIRRLATMPGFRRLTRVDALMRISMSLRSSLVQEPWRFVWNELWPGRRETVTYCLKESGVKVTIRHKSPDVLILDEMFSQHEYRFPDAVESALAAGEGPLRVIDVGANLGLFGAWILGRFPDAEIVALEPDPANAEVHRRTIEANGREATWQLIEAVAMTKPGSVRFSVGAWATSHIARAGEAGIEVEAVDLFSLLDQVDLLKIDIEGAEWPILRDPRFGQLDVPAVVMEYHPDGSPEPDPAHAATMRLEETGFRVLEHHPKDNGTGVLWGLRPQPERAATARR